MSDDSTTSPETSSVPAKGTKSARRGSLPRPKKAAKARKVVDEKANEVVDAPAPEKPKATGFPEFPESSEVQDAPSTGADRSEAEAVGPQTQEGAKRKRRRKKGKSNTGPIAIPQTESEGLAKEGGEEATAAASPQQPRASQTPRPKLDPGMLAKCAWKIYLAEISEEGVALVGDSDARELSRRCFRLAEIFMEEEARRR